MSEANVTTPANVTKLRIVTGARVEAEFELSRIDYMKWDGTAGGWRNITAEEMGAMLEKKAKEFHAFMRDHRSQDPVHLSIVRDYQDVCSACRREWDPSDDDGVPCCGYCGAPVEVTP